MNPERWKQIDELLSAVLDLDVDKRAAFLDDACVGDEQLRKEVETLLASDDKDRRIEEYPVELAADLLAEHRPILASGKLIGPYKILALIGKGGMGEVYQAKDERLGRHVAIKVLPGETSQDPESLKRLSREAKALAALSHPNIVTIYDVGSAGGISFVVMEFLEGHTLRSRIARTGLPWKNALEIAIPVGDALSAAHSKGVIHKDLKPENIFLTSAGTVKILDFGLARFKPVIPENLVTQTPTISQETSDGKISGTLQYMSPEHVQGAAVDARSDIFSFGCVLYEMITGKRPFSRDNAAETIAAILKENPVHVTELEKSIPPELEHIIDRCLEKNPDKRFQSSADLAFALREVLSAAGVSKSTSQQEIPHPPPKSIFRYASIALVLLLLVGIGWWLRSSTILKQKTRDKSIAVLPFANLSPAGEYEYFSDGITEDVVAHLSKIRNIRVISRTSTMQYKNTKKPLRQIAKELGVTTILEGSVRREGDRVRIVGQLIDAQTDSHLWAETYDRQLKDIFEIQTDVASHIAKALQAELTAAETEQIAKRPTENLQAYDYYLRGRNAYYLDTNKDVEESIQLFQKAIELDPKFANAYAWLSGSYVYSGAWVDEKWFASAEKTAHKALMLDPMASEAFITLGRIYMLHGRYTLALEQFLKAQTVDPNYSRAARWIGLLYTRLGKHDEAFRWVKKSISLDPRDSAGYGALGQIYFYLGDLDQAETNWIKGLDLNPHAQRYDLISVYLSKGEKDKAIEQVNIITSQPLDPQDFPYIGWLELCLGNTDKAREYFKKSPEMTEDVIDVLSSYGLILLKDGRREEAYKMIDSALKKLMNRLVDKVWWDTELIAQLHAVRGNREEAYRWLTDSVNQANSAGDLKWNPAFESLRSEKRFQDLLATGNAKAAEMRRRVELNKNKDL